MHPRYRLLSLLADGRFHSGEALGETLGIGRSAVWKLARSLSGRGVEVYAVRGRGYRLAAPLELLDRERIRAELDPSRHETLASLEIMEEVGSTNAHLAAAGAGGAVAPRACLAESQTAGKGRIGRRWYSPYARNLYLSVLWRFPALDHRLQGLSLAAGVAVAEALGRLGAERVGLKWPNDLVHEGRKLGGLLVEMSGEPSGPWQVVLGVGINLRMPAEAEHLIDQPFTDLEATLADPPGRNRVAGCVLDALLGALGTFEARGFAPFRAGWEARDATRGRPVTLHAADGVRRGIASGVDEEGALLLEIDGHRERVVSGELSLRAAE